MPGKLILSLPGPLSTAAGPDVRSKMLGRLNGLCYGIFSGESWTLSQGNAAVVVGQVVDGTPIDLHDELDEIWQGKPRHRPGHRH